MSEPCYFIKLLVSVYHFINLTLYIIEEIGKDLMSLFRMMFCRSRGGKNPSTRKVRRKHHHHHHRSSSSPSCLHPRHHRSSLSPICRSSRSPTPLHHTRRSSLSPTIRRLSHSPCRRPSSPTRCMPHSLSHRLSRSPRRTSRSPMRRSRSPSRRISRSPARHSPSRRISRSPSRNLFGSPFHRASRSRSNSHNRSPRRYFSPSRSPYNCPSPRGSVSRSSPCYGKAKSPLLHRSSPSQRRRSPLLSNKHNLKSAYKGPPATRKSPTPLLKTPLLTPKTPLLSSSKVPLLSNKPAPLRRSPTNQRPPLIAQTPLMKSPLLAKPPLCSNTNQLAINHQSRGAADPCDSFSPPKSPLLGKAPLNTPLLAQPEIRPYNGNNRKENIKHVRMHNFADSSRSVSNSSNRLSNASVLEHFKAENMKNCSRNLDLQPDQTSKSSLACVPVLESEGETVRHDTAAASSDASQLATSIGASLAHQRNNNKAITSLGLAEGFPHGGFSFGAPHPLLGGGNVALSLHHPHHHHHPHLGVTTMGALHPFAGNAGTVTTTPSYASSLSPSHPFSPLSSLSHHLPHHTSTFSSPLLPGPPPTPLLLGRGGVLGGMVGGYGRGVMGGLLGPGGLALGGFRLGAPGNYGGRGRAAGRGAGGVTLQEQLAKAAAAVRLSRPY